MNIINEILIKMNDSLDDEQMNNLEKVLNIVMCKYDIKEIKNEMVTYQETNMYLLNEFIAVKRLEGLSDKTLQQYYRANKTMLENLNRNIQDITTMNLRAYLVLYEENSNKKRGKKMSSVSLLNLKRYITSFFNFLECEDYIKSNPMRKVKISKVENTIKEEYSPKEIEQLKDVSNIRDNALIEFLLTTGCRVSEVENIKLKDIDFETKTCVVMGKGKKERRVFISDKSLYHIQKYIKEYDIKENENLFISMRKNRNKMTKNTIEATLKRLGKKSNVEKVYPHRFRRTFATNLINKGVPIQEVKQLLGHKKIETTMIYCNVSIDNIKLSHKKYA